MVVKNAKLRDVFDMGNETWFGEDLCSRQHGEDSSSAMYDNLI